MTRLESDFTNSVVSDKKLPFQNFSLSSPSCVFKLLKQFKNSPIISNNLHGGRKQAVCDGFISELFSEYFASVCRKPVSDYTVPTVSLDSDSKLSEVDVSPSVVSSCLQSVKNTCSVACIPAFIYKCCSSLLSPLVSFLSYLIVNIFVWPVAWKYAFVTTILKSGSPNDITNYRPFSILQTLVYVLRKFSSIIYIQRLENICQTLSMVSETVIKCNTAVIVS